MSIEIPEQWLGKAEDDYISATVLMDKVNPPQIEIACYHCQQCAEKALKAFCAYNGDEIQKTHNLIVLCQQCMILDSEFSEILSDCSRLTPYSVQTRYPNCIDILEEEAKAAITTAKRVFDFVYGKINKRNENESEDEEKR